MSNLSPFTVPDLGGTFLKVDCIKDAYSKIRISGITTNPTPEDLELALNRLENMMAEWFSRNIVVGYNFEENPDPNSENQVIRSYQDAISSCLALRIVTDFGKDVPPYLLALATSGLDNISGRVALDRINKVSYPTRQARGSGSTLRYNRWARFYRDYNPGLNNSAQETMFIGDISDFTTHFESFLVAPEIIASYSLVADPGLIISNDSNDDQNVSYRVEATDPTGANNTLSQLITIIITTDTGRVKTKQILFELIPPIRS